jgi:hypothetical protein
VLRQRRHLKIEFNTTEKHGCDFQKDWLSAKPQQGVFAMFRFTTIHNNFLSQFVIIIGVGLFTPMTVFEAKASPTVPPPGPARIVDPVEPSAYFAEAIQRTPLF